MEYLYGTNKYLCHQNRHGDHSRPRYLHVVISKASKEIHELAQAPFVRQWTVVPVPVRVPACVGSLSLVAARLLHLLLRGKIQMPKFYRKL